MVWRNDCWYLHQYVCFFVLGVGVFCIKLIMINAKVEELPAEEHAGFRPGRSTVEQIFNCQVIIEQYLTSTTLAQSVPQLHRFQEGVWQSLACRPVAGPLKLQHRGKIGSSHSGAIWKLQQCSPLQQSARRVLKDNSRCPSGMLILTHNIQPVPGENHAGNTPWPPHTHLHWWKVNMQPTICWWHWSYGQQQWWTSRPHQQTQTEQQHME